MAKQTINIGASPNDGTGTPLRTAFDYTNQNFTELYAALGGGTGLPGATNQVLFNNGTAIAGDAGMTYNPSTDTMTLVNLVLSGTFAARNGDTPSAIRAAASDYAAVAFDGATASTRITSTLTGQNIGTGDMSMWNRFRVFTTTGTTRYIASLSSSSTTADQARACLLYINSIGGLVFYLYGATTSDFRSATIAGFQTSYSGQVVDIVVTRTGATLKSTSTEPTRLMQRVPEELHPLGAIRLPPPICLLAKAPEHQTSSPAPSTAQSSSTAHCPLAMSPSLSRPA